MNIFAIRRRNRKKVQKKYESKSRLQVNFLCDRKLAARLKELAHALEVPIYPLLEHLLQLGIREAMVIAQDEALRERFVRHLVEDHLLTPVTKPESEPISKRALRIENALRLLELLETKNSPEEQREVIVSLLEQTKP